MNFFKKVGRPTEEEQMMVSAIEKAVAQKGLSWDEIPDCHTLDDLIGVRQLIDTLEPAPTVHTEDLTSFEEITDNGDGTEAPPEPEPDFEQPTNEPDFGEPDPLAGEPNFIAPNYDPFAEPIIERSYTKAQAAEPIENESDEEQLELEESGSGNLKDLPPATKRKAAEQTADALLKGYARIVPQPFKWMAKIPEDKVEKMIFNGELDPDIEVSDGVTFDEFMKQTNSQLDEIFEVQEETLEEIREPLIEVLMEQQMELTPTQRLTMAVISHLAQMFTVALKLRQQNNRILSYQRHLTNVTRGKAA